MYFEKKGRENSGKTVELAIKTAKERNIKHLVVSSNSGDTALLLSGIDANVVCVTHSQGFVKKGENEMTEEMRQKLTDLGIKVLTTSHVLSGVERGVSRKFGGAYPAEIIAHTLRMLGQGTKVCVECSVMALDAGMIPYGEEIIALGGSLRGVDTALILKPAHADSIFDTQINEYICKPFSV